MQNYIKWGNRGFEILGHLHISGMVEAWNFKFGTQIDRREYSPKMLVQTTVTALRVV